MRITWAAQADRVIICTGIIIKIRIEKEEYIKINNGEHFSVTAVNFYLVLSGFESAVSQRLK